jgi:hypothetical protein
MTGRQFCAPTSRQRRTCTTDHQTKQRAAGDRVGFIDMDIVDNTEASLQNLLTGVALRVFLHNTEDAPPNDLCFDYLLVTSATSEGLESHGPLLPTLPIYFEMQEAERYLLIAQLADINAHHISLLVHAPCVSGSDLLLAWFDPIPMLLPGGLPHELRLAMSHFSIHPKRDSDVLSHIIWIAEARTCEPLKQWYTWLPGRFVNFGKIVLRGQQIIISLRTPESNVIFASLKGAMNLVLKVVAR